MVQKRRFPYIYISAVLWILACTGFIAGQYLQNMAIISESIIMLWASVLLAALGKDERNLVYIFFVTTFFIFLLSRVCVRLICENEVYLPFSFETMKHIYIVLFVTLQGLLIGSLLNVRFIFGKTKRNFIQYKNDLDYELLRKIVEPMTFCSGLCQMALVLERMAFYQVGLGGELRTEFSSSLPSIVSRISYVYILLLCIYLATFPTKRKCILLLGQYVLISAMKLFYGSRASFILGLMFIFVYYWVRDRINVKKETETDIKWLGKKEKIFAICSIPALILLAVFIGAYRTGRVFEFDSFLRIFEQFLDAQGVSINVLGYAYEKESLLPQAHFLYLFDNTYTFLTTNPIGSIMTGKHNYAANTVERALYGTSLEQTLYYLINKQSYFAGNGSGTSYVAEVYLAFGYIGTFVFNVFFGRFLNRVVDYDFDNFWLNVIVFVYLQSLFFVPRAGFDDFVSELISTTHIIAIIMLWAIYTYFKKKNTRSGLHENRNFNAL